MSMTTLLTPLDSDEQPATVSRERLYMFATGGFGISQSLTRTICNPLTVTINLSIHGGTFDLRRGDAAARCEAAAVKALVGYSVHAPGVALATIQVAPNHPHFRAFRGIACDGILPLRRELFMPFHAALEAAYRGKFSAAELQHLFDGLIAAAAESLPASRPMDPRVRRAMDLLHADLDQPLRHLATATHLSYYRLSHLFSQDLGLPLRSYRQWQRMHLALGLLGTERRQTDIVHRTGFTDLSHFWRVCWSSQGVPPSVFMRRRIEIVPPPLSTIAIRTNKTATTTTNQFQKAPIFSGQLLFSSNGRPAVRRVADGG